MLLLSIWFNSIDEISDTFNFVTLSLCIPKVSKCTKIDFIIFKRQDCRNINFYQYDVFLPILSVPSYLLVLLDVSTLVGCISVAVGSSSTRVGFKVFV